MKTQENTVFKAFIALCTITSLGILYILLVRPQKIVVEALNTDSDKIAFYYNTSEINPSVETLRKRSSEGKHIVIVLLTPKKKVLANFKYKSLLENFDKCQDTLPCPVVYMDKEAFLKKAKRRSDLGYQPGQIKI